MTRTEEVNKKEDLKVNKGVFIKQHDKSSKFADVYTLDENVLGSGKVIKIKYKLNYQGAMVMFKNASIRFPSNGEQLRL